MIIENNMTNPIERVCVSVLKLGYVNRVLERHVIELCYFTLLGENIIEREKENIEIFDVLKKLK